MAYGISPSSRPSAGRSILAGAIGFALLALAGLDAPLQAQLQRYLAFGDSITLGVGDDPSRPERGYPLRLENRLIAAGVNVDVVNAGKGAENTAEGLTRIDQVLADNPGANVLLLMEGTNDIAGGIGPGTTRFNLNQMALKAQDRGISVVHATLIPRLPNARFDPQNINNLHCNQEIRDLAGRRQRRLVDTFEVFGSTPNLFSTYYYTGPEDPVGHPNAAGYALMADIFFDVLRNIDRVPPVIGLTTPEHADEDTPASFAIEMDVWDFGSTVDLANTTILVNDLPTGATALATSETKRAHISYRPLTPLSGIVRVRLQSRDTAATPNTVDREVMRFQIAASGPLVGDIDADGRVDGVDLVDLGRRFGTALGNPLYRAAADLNSDGSIDGTDLALLANNFGRGV